MYVRSCVRIYVPVLEYMYVCSCVRNYMCLCKCERIYMFVGQTFSEPVYIYIYIYISYNNILSWTASGSIVGNTNITIEQADVQEFFGVRFSILY